MVWQYRTIKERYGIVLKRFIKFAIVGGLGTLTAWGTVWFFTEIVGLWYMFSVMIATVITTISNFTLNYRWTFRKINE